jgi:hypothetical protein
MIDLSSFPYPVIPANFDMDTARMADLDLVKLEYCVWHHTGAPTDYDSSAAEINKYHRETNGWAGIGYHGLIRWDGNLELGRPLTKQGVHASSWNAISLAFAFSGNFNLANIMDRPEQYRSGVLLAQAVSKAFPNIKHVRHGEISKTECPGTQFPWTQFLQDISAFDLELEEAVWVLHRAGLTNSPEYWIRNAQKGRTVAGEYVAVLIKRMAGELAKMDNLVNLYEQYKKAMEGFLGRDEA